MSIKKSLWEYGKTVIRELVKEPEKTVDQKAASLEDLKLDDLKKAKIRLGLAEDKTMAEVKELQAKSRAYFEQGVVAPSTLEKEVYARKFDEMISRSKGKSSLLGTISLQTQLIDGLIQVKEMKATLDEIGIGSIVENLELSELSKYVDEAYVNGEFNQEKFKQAILVLNGGGIERSSSNDRSTNLTLRLMEEASDARDNPDLIDQLFEKATAARESKQKPVEDPFSEAEI